MTFDPYYRWLGIPPKEQPPNHYRPLSIEVFEKPGPAPSLGRKTGQRVGQTQLWASAGIVALGILALVVILIRVGGSPDDRRPPEDPSAVAQRDHPKPPKAPPLPSSRSETRDPRPVPAVKRTSVQMPSPAPGAELPPPAMAPFDAARAGEHQQAWAKYLGVPVEATNSVGMKLVLIPPGEYQMGASEADIARLIQAAKRMNLEPISYKLYVDKIPAEGPQHRVRITKPFYLGACEVTQGDFERVTGGNPSLFKGDPKRPVERVTWDSAREFCRKLSALPEEKATGAQYRLPTEAEWEYACRAGTTTPWSFGDDPAVLEQYAWFKENSQEKTQPVGQLKANAWQVYDMLGNVFEWCEDGYSPDYYVQSPVVDPPGPDSAKHRVVRGGPYFGKRWANQRCTSREKVPLGWSGVSGGFRVVLTVPGVSAGSEFSKEPSDSRVATAASTPSFDDWLQDFEAAKKKASQENKDILIAFDGSDWCSWSIKMAKEVFLQREFRRRTAAHYVLVFVDFPRKQKAKDKVRDADRNKKLSERFHVYGFPRIVLADAQGRPYGVEGYVHGGVDAFMNRLSKWQAVKSKRDKAFAAVTSAPEESRLTAMREAIEVLREMDGEAGGLGVLQFYGATLAEWLDGAKELDPKNETGDLEVVLVTLWSARLAAARADDPKQLDEVVRQLNAWRKDFKFKDPDQAVGLYLRAAQLLMHADRGADAVKYIKEAKQYTPNDPSLAWMLDRASRWITEGLGHGTGFAVAEGGYILTNHHVIDGPGRVTVQLSPDAKDRVPAKVVGKDEKGDMALLKIDVPKDRKLVLLAIAGAELRRGMRIGAFGYGGAGDVGTGLKLTQGIVSALPDKSTEEMILLDCRVNPGNSGGPLCDTRGNVIGMITAKSLSSARFESYGMALTAEKLSQFLKKHLPKDQEIPDAVLSEKSLPWDEIDQRVSGSVMKVVKSL